MEGLVVPVLAQTNPQAQGLLTPVGPLYSGSNLAYYVIAGLAFAIGGIFTGIMTYVGNVLPRWSSILFIIGAPLLVLGFVPSVGFLLSIIGAVLLGIGYFWVGYALLSQQEAPAQSQTHTQQPMGA